MKGRVVSKKERKEISIPRPQIAVLQVTVIGETSVITHAWSAKAEKQMTDKQQKKPQIARPKRDPEAEYRASMYELEPGKYGFKANAFKLAMISACRFCEGITMVYAKGAFFVMGDLLEIKKVKPHMRTDFVRVPPGPRGHADIRYRGEFPAGWEIDLNIRYNANLVEPEQLVNLLAIAGLHVGIGEQRPSADNKPGTNGMFRVKMKEDGK